MPEYSSTTITPSDGVQVPGMNGSTSGNLLLSALRDFILASKGQANGLASLGSDGKLTASQLPDLADDVIVVASYATLPATGTAGKIYITADNNKMYRWDPDLATPDYVELSIDLSAYATKAELAEEESARESADSNLLDAIDNNSQRIENLEVAVSGSLVQTNTDATMANTKVITNANEILPWAILKRVGARAVAWKSMLLYGNCVNSNLTDHWGLGSNTQCSQQSDGALLSAISGSGNKYVYSDEIHGYIQGHKYLHIIKCAVNNGSIMISLNGLSGNAVTISEMSFGVTAKSVTANASGSARTQITFDNADSMKLAYISTIDVTPMSSYSDAELQAIFCGAYYPYNAGSIIPLNPSAFKVVGKNKYEHTYVTDALNVEYESWASGRKVGALNMPVIAGQTYIVSQNGTAMTVRYGFLDVNGLVIGGSFANASVLTAPSNAVALRWRSLADETSDLGGVTMVQIGSTATAYESYSETTIDTSFTSDYLYVNENCHDYSENVLVNGVMRREEHKGIVGEVDASQQTWTYTDGTFRLQWADAAVATDDVALAGYDVCSYLIAAGNIPNMCIKMRDVPSGRFYIRNDNYNLETIEQFKATLGKIYYRRATPSTPTLHDPIPNIPCEDGTTVTAVTPQTDLVNAIDVPTTIAYMTKAS